MSTKSYLLALDGSRESLLAANVAWRLAQSNQADLTALSVVDSQAVWDLLGAGTPGFIGSGPYIEAYGKIQAILRSISETLLMSFAARSQTNQIKTECLIEAGPLLNQVFERAREHDLIIMGHRHHLRAESERLHTFIRTSLSKRLALICPCPLLVVSSEAIWSTARLVVTNETSSMKLLTSFLELTSNMAGKREIFCIAPEASLDKFLKTIKEIVPKDVSVRSNDLLEGDDSFNVAIDVPADTLLVISTRQSIEGRVTCSGVDLWTFLSEVKAISVLLLPPVDATVHLEIDKGIPVMLSS
jgi:nucleotide-binding universal stress UspA family protein